MGDLQVLYNHLMFIGKSFNGWCCAYYLPPSPPLMEGWIQEVYFTLPNLVWKLLRSWYKIGAALFQSGGCHQIHAVTLLHLQKTYWITSHGIFEITMFYRLIQQGLVSYTTSFLQMIVWCFGSKAQTFWFKGFSPRCVVANVQANVQVMLYNILKGIYGYGWKLVWVGRVAIVGF